MSRTAYWSKCYVNEAIRWLKYSCNNNCSIVSTWSLTSWQLGSLFDDDTLVPSLAIAIQCILPDAIKHFSIIIIALTPTQPCWPDTKCVSTLILLPSIFNVEKQILLMSSIWIQTFKHKKRKKRIEIKLNAGHSL